MKKSEIFFTILLLPVDLVMIIAASFLAYWLRLSPAVSSYRPVIFDISPYNYFLLVLVIGIFWLAIFALSGLYKMKYRRGVLEDFSKIIIATSAGLAMIVIYIFIRREWFDSRFLILAGWVFSIFTITLGRAITAQAQKLIVNKCGWGVHRTLILGDNQISQTICREIKQHANYGMEIIDIFTQFDMSAVSQKVKSSEIDDIILVSSDTDKNLISNLIDYCNEKRITFRFVPDLFQALTSNVSVDAVAAYPLIELKRTSLDGWGSVLKRIIDIVGSVFGLILLAPMSLVAGLAIKLDSSGPIFVRLKRVSRGELFNLIKYRSMIKNAESQKKELKEMNERKDGPLFKIKNDPRITRVGRFLRQYRLDEFPQLWNVFKGEMSLVGPRPHQPDEIANYQKHHKQLLVIKPGITGMAQVSGSSDLHFEQEVKLDVFYIENWSLFLDVKILLKTFFVIFQDKSAC